MCFSRKCETKLQFHNGYITSLQALKKLIKHLKSAKQFHLVFFKHISKTDYVSHFSCCAAASPAIPAPMTITFPVAFFPAEEEEEEPSLESLLLALL